MKVRLDKFCILILVTVFLIKCFVFFISDMLGSSLTAIKS